MKADNLIQLIGLIIQVIGGVIAIVKTAQGYWDYLAKKEEIKSKEAIEIKKAEVEIAKNNALSATHVAEVLKNYGEVMEDLEKIKERLITMKSSGDEKNAAVLSLIGKMEGMVTELRRNFTEYLMKTK